MVISSPPGAERLWGPRKAYGGYRGFITLEYSGWKVGPTTHLYLMPKLWMRGALPPLLMRICIAVLRSTGNNLNTWTFCRAKVWSDCTGSISEINTRSEKRGSGTWPIFLTGCIIRDKVFHGKACNCKMYVVYLLQLKKSVLEIQCRRLQLHCAWHFSNFKQYNVKSLLKRHAFQWLACVLCMSRTYHNPFINNADQRHLFQLSQ